jgi:FkbM family methyltransferase
MGLISEALFKHKSHYSAVLPYNLNWYKRDWSKIVQTLKDNPIYVIDVGARGKIPDEISSLTNFIDYVGFDADKEEAARLTAIGDSRCFRFRVINQFIGTREGLTQFHLYRQLGQSSSLEPEPSFRSFDPGLAIDRTVTVSATTLDVLVDNGTIEGVDLIKLDTQGTEYDVLSGGKKAVKSALLIETEVEFHSIYKDQKLFYDVSRLLYEQGFHLVYLNRVFATRHEYDGPSRGQMVFGDALFALREDIAHKLSIAKKMKYIVLLMQYGLMDFAHNLYVSDPEIQNAAPDLAKGFALWKHGKLSSLKRTAIMRLDKLILLALHWRGTNQLKWDSDRSWPVR